MQRNAAIKLCKMPAAKDLDKLSPQIFFLRQAHYRFDKQRIISPSALKKIQTYARWLISCVSKLDVGRLSYILRA